MNISWLIPAADLDAAAGESLLSRIQSELDFQNRKFIIDFSEVASVDEAGLVSLTRGLQLISDMQGQSVLLLVNDSVRVFMIAKGFKHILDLHA